MPFGRDHEFAKDSNLPGWMEDFADRELSRQADGENPFGELKMLFQRNKELTSVEDKVRELKDRIGFDLIGQDDQNPMEKTASEKASALGQFVEQLKTMADDYDRRGMLVEADAVDKLIAIAHDGIAMLVTTSVPLSVRAMRADLEPPFPPESKVKHIIDNIIRSRQGLVLPWAIIQRLRGEFFKDIEKEKINPTDPAILKYIKDEIEKMRKTVEETADDTAGLDTGFEISKEDEDLNNKMFELSKA